MKEIVLTKPVTLGDYQVRVEPIKEPIRMGTIFEGGLKTTESHLSESKVLWVHPSAKSIPVGSRLKIINIDPPNQYPWQPIETAPKDGSEILVYGVRYGEVNNERKTGIGVAEYLSFNSAYCEDRWRGVNSDQYEITWQPTHWMPLPDEPLTKYATKEQVLNSLSDSWDEWAETMRNLAESGD